MTNLQQLAEQYKAEPVFTQQGNKVYLDSLWVWVESPNKGLWRLMDYQYNYLHDRYNTKAEAIAAAKEHLAGCLLGMIKPLNQTAASVTGTKQSCTQ